MDETIIGNAFTGAGGTRFFNYLSLNMSNIMDLVLALAIMALVILTVRMAAAPGEELSKGITSIRRILFVAVFIASLGKIILWVCTAMGVAPAGIATLGNIL